MSIATTYAKFFQKPEGKIILTDLKHRTLDRTLGPEVSNEMLRYLEGQRALVSQIIAIIKQGQEKGE